MRVKTEINIEHSSMYCGRDAGMLTGGPLFTFSANTFFSLETGFIDVVL